MPLHQRVMRAAEEFERAEQERVFNLYDEASTVRRKAQAKFSIYYPVVPFSTVSFLGSPTKIDKPEKSWYQLILTSLLEVQHLFSRCGAVELLRLVAGGAHWMGLSCICQALQQVGLI